MDILSLKDFKETIKLVAEVEFAQAYSFKYSSRIGTKSSRFILDEICEEEKNDRLQQLQELLNTTKVLIIIFIKVLYLNKSEQKR